MAAPLVSSSTLQVASAALRSPFAMVDSLAAVAAMAEGREAAIPDIRSGHTHTAFLKKV